MTSQTTTRSDLLGKSFSERIASYGLKRMSTTLRIQEARPSTAPSLAELARQQADRNRQMAATIDRLMPNGLTQFVADAFEGTNTLVNVGAAMSQDDAARQIIASLEPHFETRLSQQQRAQIETAVALAWHQRIAERKAGLRDIQSRLHVPGRMAS